MHRHSIDLAQATHTRKRISVRQRKCSKESERSYSTIVIENVEKSDMALQCTSAVPRETKFYKHVFVSLAYVPAVCFSKANK